MMLFHQSKTLRNGGVISTGEITSPVSSTGEITPRYSPTSVLRVREEPTDQGSFQENSLLNKEEPNSLSNLWPTAAPLGPIEVLF